MHRIRLLLAIALGLLTLHGSAAAEGTTSASVRSGWWWLPQQSGSPLPSPVAAGEIAVGRQALALEKTAAIAFDMSGVTAPPSSVTVTLKEASATVATPGAAILACPVQAEWADASAGAWSQRPHGACVAPWLAFGTRAADGTWTFDITEMARAWHSGVLPNHGVELYPAQTPRAPSFQIALQAPSPESIRAVVGGAVVLPAASSSQPAPAEVPRATKARSVALFSAQLPTVFGPANPQATGSGSASEGGVSSTPLIAELAGQFRASYGQIMNRGVGGEAASEGAGILPIVVALLALAGVGAAGWRCAANGIDVQPVRVMAAGTLRLVRLVGATVQR